MKQAIQFLFSRWYLGLAVVVMVLLGISYILNFFIPPIPVQNNSWQGITPGYKLPKDLTNTLGNPLDIKQTETQTQYFFKSGIPVLPQEVFTDKEGKVVFIRNITTYDPKDVLKNYIDQFGQQPDLVIQEESLPDAVQLHVFLKQGVAIAAHRDGGVVEQKWYFKPTDSETFLNTIGRNVMPDSGHGPENLHPELSE